MLDVNNINKTFFSKKGVIFLSYSDLFEIHDSMDTFESSNNPFGDNVESSYYNDYIDYINNMDDDSDYYRYRYY